MARLTPLWMQNGSYPARYDRALIDHAFGEQERVLAGLVAGQTGAGALSVTVTAGVVVVRGDDEPNQGMYLCVLDADEVVTMPAAPGSNKRIDVVYARVNDPQAGGPVGDSWTFGVVQGVVAATPTAPSVPTSAVGIVRVLRTAGDGAVLTAMLTDVAPRSAQSLFGTVSTANPSGAGVVGDLWIKTA